MRTALLRSIRLHIVWLREALGSKGCRLGPLGPRRLLLLLLGYPLYLSLQAIHWAFFLLDEVLFRRYRQTPIREPLFISGIPRSGTTFLHRTLAVDRSAFTTVTTWEAILAPAILEKKMLRLIARADRRIGRPLRRFVEWILKQTAGSLDDIHKVRLDEPEEDYLLLLPAGGCFILTLAFPASESLWRLGAFDRLPEADRHALLGFYRRMLQKHLFCAPEGARLLSKNAAFASWLPSLRETFPDARVIVCVREPAKALDSQLKSLRPGLEAFGTLPAWSELQTRMETIFRSSYMILARQKSLFGVDQLAVMDQSILRADGHATITTLLRKLNIPMTKTLQNHLIGITRESGAQESQHVHGKSQSKTDLEPFAAQVAPTYTQLLEAARETSS